MSYWHRERQPNAMQRTQKPGEKILILLFFHFWGSSLTMADDAMRCHSKDISSSCQWCEATHAVSPSYSTATHTTTTFDFDCEWDRACRRTYRRICLPSWTPRMRWIFSCTYGMDSTIGNVRRTYRIGGASHYIIYSQSSGYWGAWAIYRFQGATIPLCHRRIHSTQHDKTISKFATCIDRVEMEGSKLRIRVIMAGWLCFSH